MKSDKEIRSKVYQLVTRCFVSTAKMLSMGGDVDVHGTTEVIGDNSIFDSLGFVNLIACIERELEQEHGVTLVISPSKSGEANPTSVTVDDLVEIICNMLSHD